MKVLIVGSNSVHVQNYLLALQEHAISYVFLSQDACDFDPQPDFIVDGREMNPMKIVQLNKKIRKIIAKEKPTLLHIHQANRTGFWAAKVGKRMGLPILLTTWGSDVLTAPKRGKLQKMVAKSLLHMSDKITADAQHMVTEMLKLEPQKDKYHLLQYGIDPIEPQPKEKIVYSNRLWSPLYNITKILDFFDEFVREHDDWRLVLAGAGELEGELMQQIQTLQLKNKVEVVGWLQKSENHQWYAKSSLYISIPDSDGTSVSVLEAMSAGCIPVLSNLPVAKEWIVDGENGILAKEGINPLKEALTLDWEQARTENLRRVEGVSRNTCMKEFLALYHSLESK